MPFQLPCIDFTTGELTGDYFRPLRIICLARNYAEHAQEMGKNPNEEPPFFFFKPLTAINTQGVFTLPSYSNDVHHELELIVALDSGGRNLTATQAEMAVSGFGLGLDMTCRDAQMRAKKLGHPWELAKGFDGSAPCSAIAQGEYSNLQALGNMTLTRNGQTVQSGHWSQMTWSIPKMLQEISQYITIMPGDLVFTGTPAGVGPVAAGDVLEASMQGFPRGLRVTVEPMR